MLPTIDRRQTIDRGMSGAFIADRDAEDRDPTAGTPHDMPHGLRGKRSM